MKCSLLVKKLCIASSEYLPSGSGIAVACSEMKNGFRQKGINVDVLSRGANSDILIEDNSRLLGIFGLLDFWSRATKYLSANRDEYDLIWLHQPFLSCTCHFYLHPM